MLQIDPKNTPIPVVHQYLLGGVAPRPIALVSTLSADGVRNLTPFSFFSAFGANPPTIAFSPARRGRDGTLKDTYNNLLATKECSVQAVTHSMLHQINLASAECAPDVDEFVLSGLTPIASVVVKPARVKESPFQMECILKQMIPLGEGKASGNLAICEVVMMHIAEDILDGTIVNPARIDHVARNGGNWWSRVTGANAFKLAKPENNNLIGYDGLPEFVRRSMVLSANNLAQLANWPAIPSLDDAKSLAGDEAHLEISRVTFERFERLGDYSSMMVMAKAAVRTGMKNFYLFEQTAKTALDHADAREFAWKTLILGNAITK
ncbi:MAG: flavin reductase family protein [Candidatus Zixiibacteriota bacterium]